MTETSDKAMRLIETDCPAWVARGVSELISADRALLRRAAEMLRKHEWRDVFIDNGGYGDHWELQCPSCHAAQKDGHADDCALAALIRELESRLAL